MLLPLLSYVVVLAVALSASRWLQGRGRRASSLSVAVAFGVPWLYSVLIAVRARWDSMLPQQSIVLPDEGQFLASALKALRGSPIPWSDIDGGTTGPMVEYFLLPAMQFHEWPFLAARFEMAVLIASWPLLAAIALRRVSSNPVAQIVTVPLVILGIAPWYFDWFSYTAEFVSLTLVLGFVALEVGRPLFGRASAIAGVLGFLLLGLAPFAKLQVGPLAFALGLIALLLGRRVLSSPRHLRAAWLPMVAGVTPVLLVVAGAIVSGPFRRDVAYGLGFVNRYSSYLGGGDPNAIFQLLVDDPAMGPLLLVGLVAVLLLVGALVLRLFVVECSHDGMSELMVMGVVALPLGVFCATYPGRPYPHYYLYAAFGALFTIAVAAALVWRGRRYWMVWVFSVPLITSILLVSSLPVSVDWSYLDPSSTAAWRGELLPANGSVTAGREALVLTVRRNCEEEIAVWAWDPDVYLITQSAHVTPWSTLVFGDEVGIATWVARVQSEAPSCIVESLAAPYFLTPSLASRSDGLALLADYREVFDSPAFRVWTRRHG